MRHVSPPATTSTRRSARRVAATGFFVVAWWTAAGCSTGKLTDTGDAAPVLECNEARIFCDALPAGQSGCVGFADSPDAFLRRLPADRAYPEGCRANLLKLDPKLTDVCGLAAICTCVRLPVNPADAAPDSAVDASAPDAAVVDAAPTDADSDAGPTDAGAPETSAPDAAVVDAAPVPPPLGRLGWQCR